MSDSPFLSMPPSYMMTPEIQAKDLETNSTLRGIRRIRAGRRGIERFFSEFQKKDLLCNCLKRPIAVHVHIDCLPRHLALASQLHIDIQVKSDFVFYERILRYFQF